MSNIIRFAVNIPQTVTLASLGTSVESKFSSSEQFYYKLADNACMYVHPIVHRKLKDQGACIGDTVTICKRESQPGNSGSIVWDAQIEERNDTEQGKPQPAAALLDHVKSIDGLPDAAPPRKPPTRLEYALRTALEAAKGAEEYSEQIGRPIRFDKDDIRLMAQTLVINASKEGRAA